MGPSVQAVDRSLFFLYLYSLSDVTWSHSLEHFALFESGYHVTSAPADFPQMKCGPHGAVSQFPKIFI